MGRVVLEDDGGAVARLLLDGPIDMAWATGLREAVDVLGRREGLRVVVLRAEGRFFCPGGDLAWMAAQPDRASAVEGLASVFHEGVLGLAALPVPVVARVHATAAGGGMSLVLQADVSIVAASAKLAIAYAGIGLSPDGGASWLLPRLLGPRRALDLLLTNRPLGAAEAAEAGLVTRAVPDGELDAAVDAYVERLASGPAGAYAAAKRLVAAAADRDLATHLADEAATIGALAGSPSGREGVDAFLAKRAPAF